MYKDDKDKFIEIISRLTTQYGFDGLYHFTDFHNFQSIIREGFLKSRHQCEVDSVQFHDGANSEIIQTTSPNVKCCTRFYFKEKTPMLFTTEGIKSNNATPHVPIPVYLVFDTELVYLRKSAFSDGNARSDDTRFGSDSDFFNSIDWQKVFHRGALPDDLYVKLEYKRKRHAELLIRGPVPIKYLKRIVFRSNADIKRAINTLGNRDDYEVNPNLFNNHRNFISNYKVEIDKGLKTLKLHYKFNEFTYSSYRIKIMIKDTQGNCIKEYVPQYSGELSLKWTSKFYDYDEDWYKIEFYMNDNLCIEEYLADR